jgi:DNA polymerase-4
MILLPSNHLIAHLDMNAFFASVEQQANRTLRDRPLGVCSYLGKHSCILAASISAKKLGVRTGMTIEMARQRIPDMRFLQADPVKYRSVSARVFNILRELSDCVEPYSIDEAFVDFTGWYPDELSLIEPLLHVKRRIREEIGASLTCSIGVAPTKALAKLASDHQKPDGFTMVSRASARSFVARPRETPRLPASRIAGLHGCKHR